MLTRGGDFSSKSRPMPNSVNRRKTLSWLCKVEFTGSTSGTNLSSAFFASGGSAANSFLASSKIFAATRSRSLSWLYATSAASRATARRLPFAPSRCDSSRVARVTRALAASASASSTSRFWRVTLSELGSRTTLRM